MDDQMKDLEEIENSTKLELQKLEESTNKENAKEVVRAVAKEIEKIFNDLKLFIKEQSDNEKIKETIDKAKSYTAELIEKTKKTVNDIKEDEKVQNFIDDAAESVKDFMHTVNESETFNKLKTGVNSTITSIKNNENFQKGVKKTKRATLSFAEKALSKVQNALKEDKEEEIIVHNLDKENK